MTQEQLEKGKAIDLRMQEEQCNFEHLMLVKEHVLNKKEVRTVTTHVQGQRPEEEVEFEEAFSGMPEGLRNLLKDIKKDVGLIGKKQILEVRFDRNRYLNFLNEEINHSLAKIELMVIEMKNI